MVLSYGRWLVRVGSTDISGAFYLPLLLQPPPMGPLAAGLGTSPSHFAAIRVPQLSPRTHTWPNSLLGLRNPSPLRLLLERGGGNHTKGRDACEA